MTCRHTELEPADDGYTCTDCGIDLPACGSCVRVNRDYGNTCTRCTQQTLKWLNEIVDMYAVLPAHVATIMGFTFDGHASNDTSMPGGDALVMLTPGSEGRSETNRTILHGDAPSVSEVLSRWEDGWRADRQEPAADGPQAVTTASAYLAGHNQWAATSHPAYEDYRADLRALRGRLRSVTGDSARPVRAAVACLSCEGDLIRRWTEEGLADQWECEDCGRVLAPNEYVQAVKAKLQAAKEPA